MNRIFFTFLTLLVFMAAAGKEPVKEIKFEPVSFDYGTIHPAAKPYSGEFKFVNTTDSPVSVVSATANCGCTTTEYSKKPVAPGQTGVIKVFFRADAPIGEFNKTVKARVLYGDKKPRTYYLKVTGTVIPK